MDQDAFAAYLSDRYEPQLARIATAMARSRRIGRVLHVAQFAALIAIPPLLLFHSARPSLRVALALSIVALLCTAILRAFRCEERSLQLAQIVNLLRDERLFHDTGIDGYARESDPDRLFIHRVESHLTHTAGKWKRSASYNSRRPAPREAVSDLTV